MARSRLFRAAVAPLALPHELAHALPAAAAGLSYTVTLLPDWDGDATPLGRFDASIDRSTPVWLIRVIAAAPFVLFVGLAAALRLTVRPSGPVALLVVALCSYWAAPSSGDLAVAANARQARENGRLLAPVSPRLSAAADLLTVLTTVVVAVVVLA